MEGHPYAMRLFDEETRLVVDLMKKNVKPIDILSTLKKRNKDNASSLRTIYNACQKYLGKLKDINLSPTPSICDSPSKNTTCGQVDLPSEEATRHSSHMEQEHHSCSYINQLLNIFHQYINNIHDVKSDGNCGFRAIVVCLGFHEDAWPTVQFDLMEELNKHRNEYDEIFGRENRLQIHNSLNFFRSDEAASLEHWMTMPDMGILITSRYDVILHCLSDGKSMTYLPLRSTSPAKHQHVAIAIGHVNENHYVKLELQGEYLMPPVVPQWIHFRHACTSAWVVSYVNRLNMYLQQHHFRCNFENVIENV